MLYVWSLLVVLDFFFLGKILWSYCRDCAIKLGTEHNKWNCGLGGDDFVEGGVDQNSDENDITVFLISFDFVEQLDLIVKNLFININQDHNHN